MPIVTDGYMMAPDWGIDQAKTSLGQSTFAYDAQSWADSSLSQLMTGSEIAEASGNMPDFGRLNDNTMGGVDLTEEVKPAMPRMDIIEANDRVKKAGLDKHLTLPNQPDIPPAQLAIMMRNAQARAEREATIERGPQGYIPSALQFGTSLLVGAADPLNIAAAFVPVMGELRYGKILASAGDSFAARTAVRAGVGAAQGMVGQAAMEPLDWWSHTQEGRDFGMSDVLHNIMFGAALGGGLHAGGGFISDAYRNAKGRVLYPFGPGEPLDRAATAGEAGHAEPSGVRLEPAAGAVRPAEIEPNPEMDAVVARIERDYTPAPSPEVATINDLPPRAHEDAMRTSIADLIEGNPVRAGDIIEAAAKADPRIAESMRAGTVDEVGREIARITTEARSVGSFMEIAESWRRDPETAYDKLNDLRASAVAAERELKAKYGVKTVEDLEDAPLTDAERHFLFYEVAPTSREQISEIIQQLQPISTLDEAAREIAYELKRLPQDMARLNATEQLAAMRLQVLFSEVERLGGDLNAVLKQAAQKYAARFSDPNDAVFMVQNAAEALRKMFGAEPSQPPPSSHLVAQTPRLAAPAPAGNALDNAAAWRGIAHVTPDFDTPEAIAASKAAAEVKPPKTKLDERVTAAEKADAFAKQMYDMFAHRLPEDERARLEEHIADLERKQADRDTVSQRGAACLFEGRGA